MTALDDALNASSVVLGPHQLTAQWREAYSAEATANPTDSVTNLARQFDGEMQVNHSLDDALPDTVTMTGSGDAAGVMTAQLNGADPLVLDSSGFRAYVNTQGTGNWNSASATKTITIPIANAAYGDCLLVGIVVSDNTATLMQTDPDPRNQWQYLGVIEDAPYALHVFLRRRWHAEVPTLSLSADKNVSYMGQSLILWAKSPSGAPLDFRVSEFVTLAQAGSSTTQAISTKLMARGYQIGFWGYPSIGTVTLNAPLTTVGSPALNGLVITSGYLAFRDAGQSTLTGTSSPAMSSMCMAALSLEVYERPKLDAKQYFSEFNQDSPVYGYDRDTAVVTGKVRVNTATGPVDTTVFAGQMQTVTPNGKQAELSASSRTRMRMNVSVTPPIVSSLREGLTTDWFATWLMSRGSQFVGPSPNRYTRYWAPLHGSTHAHYDMIDSYNAAFAQFPPTGDYLGRRYPVSVPGPFSLGMYAQQTATETDAIRLLPGYNLWNQRSSPFPHITEAGGPYNNDMFSLASNTGRVCFWVRADVVANFPSYLLEDFIARFQLAVTSNTGEILGWVSMGINGVGRASVTQGSDRAGFGNATYAASGDLPQDGAWHFYGVWWDFANGVAKVVHNGTESTYSGWGAQDVSGLATTDEASVARGDTILINWHFRIPCAEVMYDTGMPYTAGIWNDQYPIGSLTTPGQTATTRTLNQTLNAIALPTTINPWDTLASLGRSTLSAYRVNELDNIEFLPQAYFGETAQMTAAAVQDTRTNTQEMEPYTDASKTRNVVTVQFNETRVDSLPRSVLDLNTQMTISQGTTIVTFTMDVPAAEIHGASIIAAANSNYQIVNLTSTQVTTPSLPANRHFITVNTASDGTGSYLNETQVSAKFLEAGAQYVTVQFRNFTTAPAYLVNNGQEIPFLRVLGYGVRGTDGYSTSRDDVATRLRGERGLDTELEWVQDRTTAANLAALLLASLSRPRPQMTFTVVGDPRRKPGQVVTVADSEGTQVSGLWRVLAVQHNVSGAQYTQDLLAVQQLPFAVWDGPDGWDEGVWAP